ncbi:MAG: adenylate/guanylate cyclase domain-containing protein [Chloroflexota bacterium]|nr:adenylate/guanylate cyclase domain-containing protein [Chloroflexota bacterium]
MSRDLPSGTVTFLFTDIEGSTLLLRELGAGAYAEALAEHRRVLRQAFARHRGAEVDTQGDAFFVAFATAPGALRAAADALDALAAGRIRVRIGLHTGTPHLTDEGYVGADVHRAARIAAAGHGGQVLVSSSTAALVGTDGLRDLGAHRLKDLSAPERIYQLGEADFPPLKSLHQTNLPVPATPFLGRDQEIAELSALLARDEVRLVTLTGPGGTGKTRLALQAAATAADGFPGGVWWVPLAALRDPALVLDGAAKALGTSDDPAERIRDNRLLLLFDNFEHLVEAAPNLAGLVARCPRLTVLVTSREPLHVSGEHEYVVDPLRDAEAVALFETRALAARRDFVANGEIRQICRRLDNLPLAIELAAARVKVLSPQSMLERLKQHLPVLAAGARDAPDRQRTLRATIEWSHNLLTEAEQRLFARLAVFRGGCTLKAAEAAADADLELLQSLVDKSLVRQRDDRFWMLETIREYAAERLEASGEADERRRRHAEYFLSVAEEAEPHVRLDSLEWLDRLEAEHDNLRAALDRLEAAGDVGRLLDLAGSLWRFWYNKSHLTEGRRRLEGVLDADGGPTAARAKALVGAAVMALNLGDSGGAGLRAEQALAIYLQIDDEWGAAYSTMMMGNAAAEGGDVAGGQPLIAEAVGLFQRLGDRQYALIASTNLGWMTGELGDPGREEQILLHNVEMARELGNIGLQAEALAELSFFARDRGDFEDAKAKLREAIVLDRRRGNTLSVAIHLARLASVLCRAGDPLIAARLLSSSGALTEQVGAEVPWWAARRNAETLALLHSALDDAALNGELEAGRRMTLEEAVALALALGAG